MEAPPFPGTGPGVSVVRPGGSVVVGFDGSTGARDAVEWAAKEALERDARLRVLTCFAVPEAVDFSGKGAQQRRRGEELLSEVRSRHPSLKGDVAMTHLDPRDALTAGLTDSDLVVVGATTRGAASSWLLGSVPRAAMRSSPCPVVVVRGAQRSRVRRILVGIDSSNASIAAADWACREADLHGGSVVVVHAWLPDASRERSTRHVHLAHTDLECALDLVVDRCRRRTLAPVVGRLTEGEPSEVLIGSSADFDLIALGSRGRSGFKTMLFGSVALEVVDHAQCPVAILHPRAQPQM
jgi:nucleotide-binding universal stress UspA family protein